MLPQLCQQESFWCTLKNQGFDSLNIRAGREAAFGILHHQIWKGSFIKQCGRLRIFTPPTRFAMFDWIDVNDVNLNALQNAPSL